MKDILGQIFSPIRYPYPLFRIAWSSGLFWICVTTISLNGTSFASQWMLHTWLRQDRWVSVAVGGRTSKVILSLDVTCLLRACWLVPVMSTFDLALPFGNTWTKSNSKMWSVREEPGPGRLDGISKWTVWGFPFWCSILLSCVWLHAFGLGSQNSEVGISAFTDVGKKLP